MIIKINLGISKNKVNIISQGSFNDLCDLWMLILNASVHEVLTFHLLSHISTIILHKTIFDKILKYIFIFDIYAY